MLEVISKYFFGQVNIKNDIYKYQEIFRYLENISTAVTLNSLPCRNVFYMIPF